jgi:subtilisin
MTIALMHLSRAAVPLVTGAQTVPAGIRRIGAANTTTAAPAADVSVAILDTGVQLDHPDLNVVAGVNCVTPGEPPSDVNGHGTHCAGSVGARNNAGGVIGVAPGTMIVAVKVCCWWQRLHQLTVHRTCI